ncbi:MAG: sensor histidine kinase [Bacteroidales bacterium]|nr:sensor histidine kinase [Bacteroidales bacterium]
MLIKIALFLSVLLQFLAAIVAISLIRRTRYNISWILISVGFVLMAIRRLYELLELFDTTASVQTSMLSSWMAVLISLMMCIGVIFIKQIFNIQHRLDSIREENESKILSAIIRTEESSRQNFARELHDGLGPILSSVKMSVSAINIKSMTKDNKEIIHLTEQNIDEAIHTLREISNNLSPHILKNYGLHEALTGFIQRFKSKENLEIRLSSNLGKKRFATDIEISIYRIIGELISNTLKHASASLVDVNIFLEDKMLEVIYSDNGIGFELSKLENQHTGIGISNIESRVKSLKGKLEIITQAGEGFMIKLNLPI